ncbi:MAG: hypothetical protein L0Z62_12240 [Gemmataceae bacterium]|nr:hypothetical protein [Gemmataceae bacterium]
MKVRALSALAVPLVLGTASLIGPNLLDSLGRWRLEPPRVLVFESNLFEGITITSRDIRVRTLKPWEWGWYMADAHRYMPPDAQAATLRVLTRNVEAGRPILLEDLKVSPLVRGLGPRRRAVAVTQHEQKVAWALAGEEVDVHLTIQGQTRVIAHGVEVLRRRSPLWLVPEVAPEDRLVIFILVANPYRAALIEFARLKGELTLVPAAGEELGPAAAREEEARITAYLEGELAITEADIDRLFKAK